MLELVGIPLTPRRRRCALLAWKALAAVAAGKSEVGGRKSEVGNRKSEVGSRSERLEGRFSRSHGDHGDGCRGGSLFEAGTECGSFVNETQFAYNDFGQLITDYQAHGGAVNTSTSPKVQYGYAAGSDNSVRPTSMTYPDGRVLTYDYGTASGMNDAASRVEALVDDDVGSTHLAEYDYLGRSSIVEVDYTEPDVRYTLVGTAGGNDSDTGDVYHGFDRFGRVDDSQWYDYGASSDADRIKYGYDRASNRTHRENVVAGAASKYFDELYGYDGIDRLQDLDRGDLNAGKTAVTNLQFAEEWELDPTGNWKTYKEDSDGDATWDLEQSRTANKVNEITDVTETTGPSWVTPAYSAAGNMTTMPQPSDPTSSYAATYDAWNRLVKLVDGANTVTEYEYDGAKRRTLQKTYVAGTLDETRHLYYSEPGKWQVVEERVDASSDPDRQFVWGLRYIDDLVLRDRDTTANGTLDERLYALQDANWNVTALVDTGGTVLERYAYSAYGGPTILSAAWAVRGSSDYGWETLFAGYRWDEAVELFHVRNRVYHPVLGVWVSRDPLGLSAGVNLFEYCGSLPISKRDHNGLLADGGLAEGALATCLATGACEALAVILGIALVILMAILSVIGMLAALIEWIRTKCRRRPRWPKCPECPKTMQHRVNVPIENPWGTETVLQKEVTCTLIGGTSHPPCECLYDCGFLAPEVWLKNPQPAF